MSSMSSLYFGPIFSTFFQSETRERSEPQHSLIAPPNMVRFAPWRRNLRRNGLQRWNCCDEKIPFWRPLQWDTMGLMYSLHYNDTSFWPGLVDVLQNSFLPILFIFLKNHEKENAFNCPTTIFCGRHFVNPPISPCLFKALHPTLTRPKWPLYPRFWTPCPSGKAFRDPPRPLKLGKTRG